MTLSDNARGALYMVVSMAAFVLNDTFMKAATATVPLFQAITLRGVLTATALVALALSTRSLHARQSPRDTAILAIRSAAEVGGTILFLGALVHMPLANLTAILQAMPLAVTLAAALVFGDPIGWRRLTAICIGFVGVLIIIRPGTAGFDVWSLLGLGSVLCVVVRDLATRELSRQVPSATVAVWAAVCVTLMGLVGSTVTGWVPLGLREALLIIGAASALIVGYMFAVMVMRVGDIGFVAPFRYTSLIWAIVLGGIAFGTWPDAVTLSGAAIVVATGIFTLWRERQLRLARQG